METEKKDPKKHRKETGKPDSKPAQPHREWPDRTQKQIFEHPEVIRDLLCGFVHRSCIEELDFPTLRTLSTSGVAPGLRQRTSDCAWRVNFRDSDRYLIVVIEFQTTVVRDMVFRVLEYAKHRYQTWFRESGSGEEPEMVLITLYSGERDWNALRSLGKGAPRGAGKPARKPWSRWRVTLEYLLIQIQKYRRSRLPRDNLVSCMIALWQTHQNRRALHPYLCKLIMLLEEIGKDDLAEAFYEWFKGVLAMHQAIDERIDPKLPALEKLKLLRDAVVDWNDPDWARTWVEEGRREGHEEGHAEGHAEGHEEGRVAERKENLDRVRKRLHREAEAKFGPERAEWLMAGLARKSDPDLLMEIAMQICKGTSFDTLLKRLANGS